MSRVRATPLFVQVLGLVIVSLIAAHAVSLFIIFSLPPPPPEAYRLSEVAEALRAPGETEVAEGRPLVAARKAEPPRRRFVGRRGLEFRDELARRLGVAPERVVVTGDMSRRRMLRMHEEGPPGPAHPLMRPAEPIIFAPFRAAVRQDDGQWLTVQPRTAFRWASWQGRILLTLAVSIVLIAPLAWWFARRLAAPIAAFAGAAERLGRDPRAPPLELEGSGEVRAAVAAFNNMQERLRRYVEDRTAMVGAIAHDLRTPLTRLRFRIEGAPDELRAKLSADIDQMEAMVAAALGFVRDATNTGPRTRLELASLAESIFDEAAETGADASVETGDRIVIEGDPLALRRMISNLLENAVKYGARARGRVFARDGQAVIEIDDDGPGIPPGEMERVFEPFFRGEPSRSRETGGAGLGLAVVRSIARAHGGDIELINRAGGGLTARVTLLT
ncbi:MAG TPA: ATP-binding protein [Caulobacteraceae bacterium]